MIKGFQKFNGVLQGVRTIVKYAGLILIVVDTLKFFQDRLESYLSTNKEQDNEKLFKSK